MPLSFREDTVDDVGQFVHCDHHLEVIEHAFDRGVVIDSLRLGHGLALIGQQFVEPDQILSVDIRKVCTMLGSVDSHCTDFEIANLFVQILVPTLEFFEGIDCHGISRRRGCRECFSEEPIPASQRNS